MKKIIIVMILILLSACYSETIFPQIINNIQESGFEDLYVYSTSQREKLLKQYNEFVHLCHNTYTGKLPNRLYKEIMIEPTSINFFFVDSSRYIIEEDAPSYLVNTDAFFDGFVLSSGLRTHLYRAENTDIALLAESLSIYDIFTYEDTFEAIYILTYYSDALPEILTILTRVKDSSYITKTLIINPEPKDINYKSELIINTIYSLHEGESITAYKYKP